MVSPTPKLTARACPALFRNSETRARSFYGDVQNAASIAILNTKHRCGSAVLTQGVKMRSFSSAMVVLLVMLGAETAQGQEVKRQQVQAVDYQAQAAVAVDSMAADLASLDSVNTRIVDNSKSLASLYSQLGDDFEKIVSIADRLRRTSQEPSPASALQGDLIRAIDEMQAQLEDLQGQFLALQNSMQQESRRFQTISNAMRARHDMAMNSIRNMK